MRPYLRIAEVVRERIRSGALPPGARVPSTRALVRDHGVALATATRALATLRDEGWVVARPRVGTVVADAPPVAAPRPASRPAGDPPASPPAAGTNGALLPREATRAPFVPPAAGSHPAVPTRASPASPASGGMPAPGPPPAPDPTRGEAPDRDAVVRSALRVADAEGLTAVSMRRLAAELGVATMSLYGPVRGKDDLVLGMIEASFGDDPFPPAPPPGWRAALEVSARRQWRIYRRRPWLATVVNLTRPQGLDCLLDLADWDLAALEHLDLDGPARLDRHILLCTFVRGMAVSLGAETEAALDTGVDADTWVDRNPQLRAALDRRRDGPLSRAGAYDLDLDHLMDLGLASLLDGFARAPRPGSPP